MDSRYGRAWAAALLLLGAGSCRTAPSTRGIGRYAILPFENLTGDSGFDWLGATASAAVVNQLIPARQATALATPSLREAFQTRPSRLVLGYVDRTAAGLRLRAVIEDAGTHQAVAEFTVARPPEKFLEAIDALARQLSPEARAPLTTSWNAFAAFGRGQRAGSPEDRERAFEEAIAADANYALPYLALAELKLAGRNGEAARGVLERLTARKPAPFEAAQAKTALAAIAQDGAARVEALKDLAAASPANAALQFQAGAALVTAKRFREGATVIERGLAADPDNGEMWNQLGYAKAYQRDLAGARAALGKYAQLAPGPNNIDSLAEVHYLAGEFGEAKRLFLENHQKTPQFMGDIALLKAAYSAFRHEGAKAADPLFAEYVKKLRGGPLDAARHALEIDWLAATGRRAEAVAKARAAGTDPNPAVQAIASVHLCGYQLTGGERAAALESAKAALKVTPNNLAAVLCFFAAQPAAAEPEWMVRADRLFGDPRAAAIRKQALAYAFLFDAKPAAAEVLLRDLYAQAGPEAEGEWRVALASALVAQNKNDEARA